MLLPGLGGGRGEGDARMRFFSRVFWWWWNSIAPTEAVKSSSELEDPYLITNPNVSLGENSVHSAMPAHPPPRGKGGALHHLRRSQLGMGFPFRGRGRVYRYFFSFLKYSVCRGAPELEAAQQEYVCMYL